MAADSGILLGLFTCYIAAQVGAEVAQRAKLPAVVGEITAGAIIGPSVLGWLAINAPMEALAEIGAVILLFSVGLETRAGDLKKVGRSAMTVGVLGIVVPFVMGALWAHWSGYPTAKSMFIAAAFVATSAGITARVLHDLGVLGRIESRVILGAAVIDDILAMLLLGIVTSLQEDKGVDLFRLSIVVVQALGFIALIVFIGLRVVGRRSQLLDAPINPLSPLTLSLAACLGLGAAAANIGLAAIIGAFLAGMMMAESKQRHALEKQIQPIMAFIVPFFFVVTGAKVAVSQFGEMSVVVSLLVVTLLAIAGKLIGCGLGALSLGRRGAAIVGVGMVPRGEVGIIVASLGLSHGIFSDEVYAIIIGMSLLTSVLVAPVLKYLFGLQAPPGEEAVAQPELTDEEESLLGRVDEAGFDIPRPQPKAQPDPDDAEGAG
ncbi:MAG: cation:proton antiporter [Armatimonadetes bacterium]|nr:cation:proton antiporter [Armatimonadota bacterium]